PVHVPLGALSRTGVDSLVHELGALVHFRPSEAALERIHAWSAGNRFALRALCGQIVDRWCERSDYSPLAAITIDAGDVDDAARALAVHGPTFRDHLLGWLDEREQQILHYVAVARPRRLTQIRRALGDDDGRTTLAVTTLQAMGVIRHK